VYRCLYFKSRPGVEEMGIVVAIRTNGFVAFVPRYGFRGNVILKVCVLSRTNPTKGCTS
jgi:exoribonuclease R